ncbi:hypothetical protein GW17_00054429, partial [Ensete ventricosum]
RKDVVKNRRRKGLVLQRRRSCQYCPGLLWLFSLAGKVVGKVLRIQKILVHVSKEFLEAVEGNIKSQRPPWRVDASKFDVLHESALIISDHSIISGKG